MIRFLLKRSGTRYLKTIILVLVPAFIVLGVNGFILLQSGEMQPVSRIAQRIIDENYIFESGVHDLKRELNLELIRQRKPAVVAFGSSRPLNFRQEYFRPSAVYNCACMAVPNLTDGLFYADKLLATHRPDVVILSVDFWWFTTPGGVRPKPLFSGSPPMTFQKLFKPMQLIMDHTISIRQYIQLLRKNNDFTHTTTYGKGGLLGIIRGMGTRKDGSFLNGIRFTDYANEYYKDWRQILHNPEQYIQKNDRYGPGKKIIEDNIRDYAALVRKFHDEGIKVVAVMLPLAPTIHDALSASPAHRYIFEIAGRIAGFSDEFYDLHNPRLVS